MPDKPRGIRIGQVVGNTFVLIAIAAGLGALFILRHPGYLFLVLAAVVTGHFINPLPKDPLDD